MTGMGNAARGTHAEALEASRTVYETRVKLAKLFGCRRPDHVVFTCNSTEALNIAINGLFAPGDHVITTDLEHNSVLRPLYRLEDAGTIALSVLPADRQGRVDCGDLAGLFRGNTRAVVCTHASNLTGNLLDIARIGALAHSHGALLIVDASQTAGAVPIDMERMKIDVLCFTGHKGLMGPQGTGGLCIREGVDIRPWKVGGSGVQSYRREQPSELPTRLEAGTLNAHGIAGLSAALDFLAETGVETIAAHERALARRFYEGVSSIDGVQVYGDFSTWERAAIVSLNIRDWDSALVSDELSETYGIATRPGAHCAPRMHTALGTRDQGAVRFSFSWFNTADEADAAIRAVEELAN
jgi:cysteine desulfurase family protein